MIQRALLAVLLVASVARAALADPPDAATLAEADRLLREGNAHYAARRHDEAIAAYQRAYDLTGAPGFLFNIAQVHRVAGHCREAIDHYERFLAADPKTRLRPKVERFVADLWRCVEAQRREAEARREPATEPTREPAAAAEERPAAAHPAVADVDAAPAGPAHPRWRWAGLGLAAAGVMAIAGGVYLGLEARSAARDTERFTGEWDAAQERREEGAARDERNAVILTSAGGAAVAGGLALFVWAGSF